MKCKKIHFNAAFLFLGLICSAGRNRFSEGSFNLIDAIFLIQYRHALQIKISDIGSIRKEVILLSIIKEIQRVLEPSFNLELVLKWPWSFVHSRYVVSRVKVNVCVYI